MQKIRSNAALLVVLIGLAMVAFILSDMFKSGGGGRQAADPIGMIYGNELEPMEFLDLYQGNLENEGNPSDPARRAQVWQRTWDGFINQKIFSHEYESSGNKVPNAELTAIFQNPPPNSDLRGIRDFQNQETGMYDPQRFFQFYEQARQIEEPQNEQERRMRDYMKDVEEYVYLNRLRDKYFGLLKKASYVGASEATRVYNEENKKADIKYLFVSFANVQENEVEVTKEEMRSWYNDNKEMFRREAEEVDIKYVYFEKLPAADDTLKAINDLAKLVPGYHSAKNDTEFVYRNQGVFDTTWQPLSNLPAGLLTSADTLKAGDIAGPFESEPGKFSLVKIRARKEGGDPAVHVRHIVYKFSMPPSKEDSLRAKEQADNQRKTITSINFADAASINSQDNETKNKGGDVGWITFPSQFGEDYDKVVKNAAKGAFIVAPVPGGYAVVEVMDRTTTMVQFSAITKEVFAGTATIKKVYQDASRFANEVEAAGDLETAAEKMPNINVRKNPAPITPATTDILGLVGAQELISWALKGNTGDRTTEIIDTENAFVIAQIVEKREKGFKKLEEVEETVKASTLNRLKARYVIEKLKEVGEKSSLEEIASAYGPGANVLSATGIGFTTTFQDPIGAEPKVFGRAFGLELNEISKPVVGTNGVFMVQTVNITEPQPANPELLAGLRQSRAFGQANFFENNTYQALKEIANVVDLRRNHRY